MAEEKKNAAAGEEKLQDQDLLEENVAADEEELQLEEKMSREDLLEEQGRKNVEVHVKGPTPEMPNDQQGSNNEMFEIFQRVQNPPKFTRTKGRKPSSKYSSSGSSKMSRVKLVKNNTGSHNYNLRIRSKNLNIFDALSEAAREVFEAPDFDLQVRSKHSRTTSSKKKKSSKSKLHVQAENKSEKEPEPEKEREKEPEPEPDNEKEPEKEKEAEKEAEKELELEQPAKPEHGENSDVEQKKSLEDLQNRLVQAELNVKKSTEEAQLELTRVLKKSADLAQLELTKVLKKNAELAQLELERVLKKNAIASKNAFMELSSLCNELIKKVGDSVVEEPARGSGQ